MSFIDKLNRFAGNPINMDMKRSKFNLSHGHKLTMVAGKLVPILCDEILPDDTIKLNISSVIRSITPALPVMDNAYFDVFAFWVPSRICTVHDKDWQRIHGENTNGFWAPPTESTLINTGNTFVHSFSDPVYATPPQSLADYLGIPVGYGNNSGIAISRLPFNAYSLIWDEWFRDQNTQAPTGWKSWGDANLVDKYFRANSCLDVNKFHDYFTSALPSPQKGSSVLLPMAGSAPVITGTVQSASSLAGKPALVWASSVSGSPTTAGYIMSTSTGETLKTNSGSGEGLLALPSNLYADLTNATAVSVNEMRQAFAIQKLFEKDARGGTRYREVLMTHFGVSIPDNTVQVPEYLGGKRIPLNMMQVLQTSENGTSPLGSTGAFSNTGDSSDICVKSFAEHGFLMVLGCIRTNQSYSQGLSRMFTRYRRFDTYYPVFANLGEQAIREIELYANSASTFDEVFGYQEAWAEYRFKPTKLSGYLSANSGDTVAQSWTYGNRFTAKPVLNSDFMKQPRVQVDNTLVIANSTYQFVCDFFFNYTAWRAMPYYSIPGLIDHH